MLAATPSGVVFYWKDIFEVTLTFTKRLRYILCNYKNLVLLNIYMANISITLIAVLLYILCIDV